MSNVYYSPEEHGLSVVAEIDYSSGDYEFDYRVVWQHKDGALYTARDSGCSCPSPFEDYGSLAELDRVDIRVLEDEAKDQHHGYRSAAEREAFLNEVRKVFKRECPGCGESGFIPADDYLCVGCRE